jgi:hypothetical protein
LRIIQNGAHLMIVPTIGIVIENYDGGAAPFRLMLEEIDRANNEPLLVQRILISRVTVLETRSLEEADGRKIARGNGVEEIVNIVLVVGDACVADLSY